MIKELLKSRETFATPVVLYLFSKLGLDVFSYELETIEEYLKSLQPATPKVLVNRVNAALGLFNSNLFWVDPTVFTMVCRSLNRKPFPESDEPTPGDITWGVTEAQLLYDGTGAEGAEQFSPEVKAFAKFIFKSNGLFAFPQVLKGFGPISDSFRIDDPELALARQNEADASANKLDLFAASQTMAMFNQIKALNLPLLASARGELDNIIQQYKEIGVA